ncbi:MAG: transcriptional regulator GcvA [Deltaproteobacteria bacterium]|nr:transcriptional regulator GcvA [Deltaproteobacteria bacterium]
MPPLNALRTFECAARLGSMTKAARELNVTQTAVSHQVRQLEEHLGARLFTRSPGRLVLTHEGAAWAAALGDVFGRLHAANRRLRAVPPARPIVSLTVLPSFAAVWLVPRLGRFFAAHPGVDLRLSPSERLVDLDEEAFDLGIRYGSGRQPGPGAETLSDDAWVVVSAPELVAKLGLRSPHDLRDAPLLRDDDPSAWGQWLDARRVRGIDWRRGAELSDSAMVVDAAVRGQGVALARISLAQDALESGRLVRPFPRVRPMPTGRRYTLVWRRSRAAAPEVRAFRAWLLDEIGTLRALVGAS